MKEKIFLIVGVSMFMSGAYMIHIGFGTMIMGALFLVFSYFEFTKKLKE